MEPPAEEFADGQGHTFEDDIAKAASSSRRHSLAALKDIVTGRKDWWDKKASKTGAAGARGSVISSVALPNLTASSQLQGLQGRPVQGLLFSLPPPTPPSDAAPATNQPSPRPTPASPSSFAAGGVVSQSLPQLSPKAAPADDGGAVTPTPSRSPSMEHGGGESASASRSSSLKRMGSKLFSKLTGRRSPKVVASASAAASPHSPSASSAAGTAALSSPKQGAERSPAAAAAQQEPVAFGSPATSSATMGADDTRSERPDQALPLQPTAAPPARRPPGLALSPDASLGSQGLDQAYSAHEDFSPAAGASPVPGSPAEVQSALKAGRPADPAAALDAPGHHAVFDLGGVLGHDQSKARAPALASEQEAAAPAGGPASHGAAADAGGAVAEGQGQQQQEEVEEEECFQDPSPDGCDFQADVQPDTALAASSPPAPESDLLQSDGAAGAAALDGLPSSPPALASTSPPAAEPFSPASPMLVSPMLLQCPPTELACPADGGPAQVHGAFSANLAAVSEQQSKSFSLESLLEAAAVAAAVSPAPVQSAAAEALVGAAAAQPMAADDHDMTDVMEQGPQQQQQQHGGTAEQADGGIGGLAERLARALGGEGLGDGTRATVYEEAEHELDAACLEAASALLLMDVDEEGAEEGAENEAEKAADQQQLQGQERPAGGQGNQGQQLQQPMVSDEAQRQQSGAGCDGAAAALPQDQEWPAHSLAVEEASGEQQSKAPVLGEGDLRETFGQAVVSSFFAAADGLQPVFPDQQQQQQQQKAEGAAVDREAAADQLSEQLEGVAAPVVGVEEAAAGGQGAAAPVALDGMDVDMADAAAAVQEHEPGAAVLVAAGVLGPEGGQDGAQGWAAPEGAGDVPGGGEGEEEEEGVPSMAALEAWMHGAGLGGGAAMTGGEAQVAAVAGSPEAEAGPCEPQRSHLVLNLQQVAGEEPSQAGQGVGAKLAPPAAGGGSPVGVAAPAAAAAAAAFMSGGPASRHPDGGAGGGLSLGALQFEPMDLMDGSPQQLQPLGGGFTFDASAAGEVPLLEATPSPVASKKGAQHMPFAQDVRESMPLFSDRPPSSGGPHNPLLLSSSLVHDSLALDRLSLDDIAPFSRKKAAAQHHQPALDTLAEDPLGVDVASGSPAVAGQQQEAAAGPAAAASSAVVATAAAVMHAAAPQQQTPAAGPRLGARSGAVAGHGSALHRAGAGANNTALSAAAAVATVTPGGQLSGRSRIGGMYGMGAGASASSMGAAAATPGPPASAVKPGAKAGSAGLRAGAADAASTPLTQQAGMRKPASTLKKAAPTASRPGAAAATPAATAASSRLVPGSTRKTGSPPEAARQQQQHSPAAAMLAAAQGAHTPQPPTAAAAAGGATGVAPAPNNASLVPASWATPLAQMAALPLDAALHAPLVDLSPLMDDWGSEDNPWGGRDGSGIAEEARRLFSTLGGDATAAGGEVEGGGAPAAPGTAARTVAAATALLAARKGALRTPEGVLGGGGASRQAPAPSPSSVQILEMQLAMMVQKLADAEGRQAALEKDNDNLRDQLRTVEFQSGMPSQGVEEMERQARQCAEEQLSQATQRLQLADEALTVHRREAEEAKERAAALQGGLEEERAAHGAEAEGLRARLNEALRERDASGAQAESLAAQLSSKARECDAFAAALAAEQRRVDELQMAVKSKDADVGALQRSNAETSAKLQKALESLTTVQVNQRRQAAETESKTAALSAAMARMQDDRNGLSNELAQVQARRQEAEAQVAQMRKELAAAAAENKELLTICNQLLSQVEKNSKKAEGQSA